MIKKLLCNGKFNPIGVSASKIKLSITVENEVVESVIFRVFDNNKMLNGSEIINVESKELFVNIDCFKLVEQYVYYWNVEVHTKNGVIISDIAFFETDIFCFGKAKWICNSRFNGCVSRFKKSFEIKGAIDKARLYIVGLGAYQSQINGKKTDEFYYKPLLTDFGKRSGLNNLDYDEDNFDVDNKEICFNTFDVTELLVSGTNEIIVLLGTGWYYDTDKSLTDPKFYYDKPKLIFELHYWQDGVKKTVYSDGSCLCQTTGKTSQLFACDKEDFTEKENPYYNAEYATAPTGKLISSQCETDKIREIIEPMKICLFNRTVYDFNKNHSGSIYLKVKGKKNGKLTIKYYEFYDEKGLNSNSSSCILFNENVKPIGLLSQTDEYVLSGNIDEISPLFSWKCYRYVTVDCDGEVEIIDIKSFFICSPIETDGEFSCSNRFIQRFYNAYILTQSDNMHCGVLSDCPHREKLPYTGDSCLTIDSVLYNFDCEVFYSKWLNDIISAQGKNGWIPYSAPYIGGSGGYFWSNVITVLPLKLYYYSGNTEYIARSVDSIKRYIDYCVSMLNDDYLLDKTCIRWLLGEWLTPKTTEIDIILFNTMAFYVALDNSVKIAEITSLKEDKKYYEFLKAKLKKAINKKYFNNVTLDYDKGTQGINLFALSIGIVPKKYEKQLFAKVKKHYTEQPYFDTGIIVTPVLLDYLTRNGESDLAYKIFTYKGKPSFYAMLKNETTLCEHWNKKWPDLIYDSDGNMIESYQDVSHCHPLFGSVVSWMHKYIAGLDLSALYKKEIIFNPRFVSKIKKAKAKKMTAYGKTSIEYGKINKFVMKIEIPHGYRGKVYVNEKDVENLFLGDKKLKANKGYYTVSLDGGSYSLQEK